MIVNNRPRTVIICACLKASWLCLVRFPFGLFRPSISTTHDESRAQLSKKGLVHALRKIVRVRNTRRLQERASFARALHKASRTINSDDGDGDSAAISSIKSSSSMASPHNWLQLSTDDSSSVTSIISPFATGSSNRSNILLEECSVKPFVSLMKILRLASDVPGGLPDSKFKSSGVLSSVNYEDSRTFPTRGLAEGFTLHGKRGNEAGNISFDCVEKMSHSLVGGGLTDHHLYYRCEHVSLSSLTHANDMYYVLWGGGGGGHVSVLFGGYDFTTLN